MSNKYHSADLLKQTVGEYTLLPYSGVNFNLYSPYYLKDVFTKNNLGEYRVNIGDLEAISGNSNTIFAALNATLFYYSGVTKKRNWSFSIKDEVFAGVRFKKELLHFINSGNAAYIDKQLSFQIPVQAIHFRSFNYSWASQFSNKLQLGYTAKMYFGKYILKMNTGFTSHTSTSLREIAIGVNGSGIVSSPVKLDNVLKDSSAKFNWMKYLFELRNPGVGIDLSMNYQINKLIELKAGIENFGFILWTSNTTIFTADNNYNWQGIDLSGQLNLAEMGSVRNNETVIDFKESFLNRLI
ncbi:MAG: DUF5723 family protein, partial [Prolixibacteraceae bacterium]|nr:DUF5723 family protein [Prolixibacteraceae bacterium]